MVNNQMKRWFGCEPLGTCRGFTLFELMGAISIVIFVGLVGTLIALTIRLLWRLGS